LLNIENFNQKFRQIVSSEKWKKVEEVFKKSTNVFLFGNGGNLAVADHAAIDISRLTDKNAICPGSGITATSIIGDKDAEGWLETWVKYRLRGLDPANCMIISFSCSTTGTSSAASIKALEFASALGISSVLISAQPKPNIDEKIISISQDVSLYHTSEILSLALTYQLTHSAGFVCPSVFEKARTRRFETLGIESEVKTSNQHVPPGLEDQLKNLAIDFDGVIHNFDKGWHDGTCYGLPIPGSLEAIKALSKDWNIIIYSAKVRPDRPIVNGKTGYELVKEWLQKYSIDKYVSEITHEKPRAQYYIDDKAIKFENWAQTLEEIT